MLPGGRAHGSMPFGGRGMKTASSPLAARACLSVNFHFSMVMGEETTLLFTNAEKFSFRRGCSHWIRLTRFEKLTDSSYSLRNLMAPSDSLPIICSANISGRCPPSQSLSGQGKRLLPSSFPYTLPVVKKALSITTSLDTPPPDEAEDGRRTGGADGNQRDNLKKNGD